MPIRLIRRPPKSDTKNLSLNSGGNILPAPVYQIPPVDAFPLKVTVSIVAPDSGVPTRGQLAVPASMSNRETNTSPSTCAQSSAGRAWI